jgi:hypothetical protein
MKKVVKEEAVRLLAELRNKGYSNEELAVMLGRTAQTIWAWGSVSAQGKERVPPKSDYEVLKRLTVA